MDPAGLRAAAVEEPVISEIASLAVGKARPKIEHLLKTRGFLTKVEDHKMALGKCYRCKTIVEPYLSPQWFVKIKPLAEPAIKAVEDGRIRLIPEGWVNNYLGWMRDIKDWCISRQIWWGHQIPAWYCRSCNEDAILETASKKSFTIAANAKPIVARAAPAHCPDCSGGEFIRDPDVLDTWFSSALWPFSTLGWPEQTPELKTFYPTSTLVTGLDILFFWVARMIMMGLKFTGQVPFRDVYIHALVRDVEGQKMSKSKGNVIDPLSVMDQYGTDALRFTLASMASPGRDIKLAEERIEGYRNFANKIWNAARFILMNLEAPRAESSVTKRSDDDKWIISRLQRTIHTVANLLEEYRFDEAANALYHFIWHEYCDQYIERAKLAMTDKSSPKAELTRATLAESFETMLRLLHPFMPYITEEIWQQLPHVGESITVAPYPTPNDDLIDELIEQEHEKEQRVVASVSSATSAQGISPSQKFLIAIVPSDEEVKNFLEPRELKITSLTRASELWKGKPDNIPNGASPNIVVFDNGHAEIYVWTQKGAIDIAKEINRKEKRHRDLSIQIEQRQKKLSNPDFVANAPPHVKEKNRKEHEEYCLEREKLSQELRRLREMEGKTG